MAKRKYNEEGLTRDRVRELLNYDPKTGKFTWRVRTSNRIKVGDVAGVKGLNGYIFLSIDNHKLLAHRVVWYYVHGKWPPECIDHINGVRDDNRLENLRLATVSQNATNGVLRATNTSGYRGVSWSKAKQKWVASITKERKQMKLGYFKTKEDAHFAYLEAARQMHGDFGGR